MSELVIDFKIDGTTKALHMDGFDLGFLGPKKITRQTEIVFREATQLWDIEYINDAGKKIHHEVLNYFPSYEAARGMEVAWVNDCRLMGIHPDSEEGWKWMSYLRAPE